VTEWGLAMRTPLTDRPVLRVRLSFRIQAQGDVETMRARQEQDDNPKESSSSGSAAATGSSGEKNAARSSRMQVEVPVVVRGKWKDGTSLLEEAKTITASARGGVIALADTLAVGQALHLTNPQNGKHLTCYVRSIKPGAPGMHEVEVQFATASPRFWGLDFPPSDEEEAERKLPQARTPRISGRLIGWAVLAVIALAAVGILASKISRLPGVSRTDVQENSAAQPPAAPPGVASQDASVIPGIEHFRIAAPTDFDSAAVSWLKDSGTQISGTIPGNYSGTGESRAYVLVGKDQARRLVIVADGRLRCDAAYLKIAVVARVPKEFVRLITWTEFPAPEGDGDGLLIVRDAKTFGSGVVLFLRGNGITSAAPRDYRQVPLGQSPR
jgi:hypothetical protein